MTSAEPFIYILVFLAVLVLVQGVYLVVFGRSYRLDRQINRRLALLEKAESRDQVLDQLRKEMGQHIKAQRIPIYALLAEKAQKANLALSPPQLIAVMIGAGVAVLAILQVLTSVSFGGSVLIAALVAVGGVYVWLNNMANKRMAQIGEQLPDAVELMVRSLRVGHPFSNAVVMAARELPDPLGTELGIVADETAYGRDMGETLRAMAERLDNQDLRFLAVAVTIQQTSGGNLAEILDGLAKVIRARFRLYRRVLAITAEAKWSGNLLSSFPVLALVGISVFDPTYFDDVMQSPNFVVACLIIGAMLVLNIVVMRALVDIKV
jgi:tight adherence protein B